MMELRSCVRLTQNNGVIKNHNKSRQITTNNVGYAAALYGSQSDPHGAAFLFLHIQPQMPFNSPLNFLLLDTDIPLRNGGGAML